MSGWLIGFQNMDNINVSKKIIQLKCSLTKHKRLSDFLLTDKERVEIRICKRIRGDH